MPSIFRKVASMLPSPRLRFFYLNPPRTSSSRRRELRHEAHGDAELVELEMRLQEHARAISPRLALHVGHVDPRLAQRQPRLRLLPRVIVQQDIIGDPVV